MDQPRGLVTNGIFSPNEMIERYPTVGRDVDFSVRGCLPRESWVAIAVQVDVVVYGESTWKFNLCVCEISNARKERGWRKYESVVRRSTIRSSWNFLLIWRMKYIRVDIRDVANFLDLYELFCLNGPSLSSEMVRDRETFYEVNFSGIEWADVYVSTLKSKILRTCFYTF